MAQTCSVEMNTGNYSRIISALAWTNNKLTTEILEFPDNVSIYMFAYNTGKNFNILASRETMATNRQFFA